MKIADVSRAKRLIDERLTLATRRDDVERGNILGVTLSGEYQDKDMLNAVRPWVAAELQRRIDGIEHELDGLGVTID
ncbi:hypothetical protein [Sphingomonas sp. BK580]|uniref:hypothetical protein n=1 Tax=Sphingomonas sp. BK580 TaxID=2586972 RepID=UPI001621456F|nr:hypothetical protein [Sphingomonas sp. BK580]MBB3691465.1 hypothetical protein [Sphingomonas sp. BK580]